MQNVTQLANVIIVVSCVLLAASYFLPAETQWAPFDAWRGYYVGDEFVKDFNMALIETFPFGVGPVVLVALALSRQPKAGVVTLTGFATSWVISLVCAVSRVVQISHYQHRILWLALALSIGPAMTVIFLLLLRKYHKMITVLSLGVVLAASSVLQQSCSIGWYLLEDKLLLNIGSVTGMVAAAVLFVGLLVKTEVLAYRRAKPDGSGPSVNTEGKK